MERKGRPAFTFEEDDNGFSGVEGPKGQLTIPHLPDPIDPRKTRLVQSGENFYEPFNPFEETGGALSRRHLEYKFRQSTELEPDQAVFVRKVPRWKAEWPQYEVTSLDEPEKTEKQIRKEQDDLARGIR